MSAVPRRQPGHSALASTAAERVSGQGPGFAEDADRHAHHGLHLHRLQRLRRLVGNRLARHIGGWVTHVLCALRGNPAEFVLATRFGRRLSIRRVAPHEQARRSIQLRAPVFGIR